MFGNTDTSQLFFLNHRIFIYDIFVMLAMLEGFYKYFANYKVTR